MEKATQYPGLTDELKYAFDRYVGCVLSGVPQIEAALRCGVSYKDAAEWVRCAETDRYVQDQFRARLSEVRSATFWSAELAAVRLKQIVDDPNVKDATRLNALRELNVLRGVTFVDDKGNTRANGHTLDDFYRLSAEAKPREPVKH